MFKRLRRWLFGPSKAEVNELNEVVWKGFHQQVGRIPDNAVTDDKIVGEVAQQVQHGRPGTIQDALDEGHGQETSTTGREASDE